MIRYVCDISNADANKKRREDGRLAPFLGRCITIHFGRDKKPVLAGAARTLLGIAANVSGRKADAFRENRANVEFICFKLRLDCSEFDALLPSPPRPSPMTLPQFVATQYIDGEHDDTPRQVCAKLRNTRELEVLCMHTDPADSGNNRYRVDDGRLYDLFTRVQTAETLDERLERMLRETPLAVDVVPIVREFAQNGINKVGSKPSVLGKLGKAGAEPDLYPRDDVALKEFFAGTWLPSFEQCIKKVKFGTKNRSLEAVIALVPPEVLFDPQKKLAAEARKVKPLGELIRTWCGFGAVEDSDNGDDDRISQMLSDFNRLDKFVRRCGLRPWKTAEGIETYRGTNNVELTRYSIFAREDDDCLMGLFRAYRDGDVDPQGMSSLGDLLYKLGLWHSAGVDPKAVLSKLGSLPNTDTDAQTILTHIYFKLGTDRVNLRATNPTLEAAIVRSLGSIAVWSSRGGGPYTIQEVKLAEFRARVIKSGATNYTEVDLLRYAADQFYEADRYIMLERRMAFHIYNTNRPAGTPISARGFDANGSREAAHSKVPPWPIPPSWFTKPTDATAREPINLVSILFEPREALHSNTAPKPPVLKRPRIEKSNPPPPPLRDPYTIDYSTLAVL